MRKADVIAEMERQYNHCREKAAEYISRLANGQLPEMKVEINYPEARSTESDRCSLLMVKKYWRNLERALKNERK